MVISLTQIQALSGSLTRGYAIEKISKSLVKIDPVDSITQNFRKILKGRVDFAADLESIGDNA